MTFAEHRAAEDTALDTSATTDPTGWYASGGKRAIDVVVVIPLLVLAAPVLTATAVALRIKLGPGIVLRQERIGRHAAPFAMYKFRTMELSRRTVSPEMWDGPDRRRGHKRASDPRHTTLGRMLRKFSIDELPQLVNVLKGDMSLVGPRPQLIAVASPSFRAHRRHQIRPGLTGPFQVSALRAEGDLEAGLDIDSSYLDNLSLRNDLRVLLSTLVALSNGTGS
jgi:lipopolysaccharide/colanic/teichoic acid biosynthesis glycosyltransferase